MLIDLKAHFIRLEKLQATSKALDVLKKESFRVRYLLISSAKKLTHDEQNAFSERLLAILMSPDLTAYHTNLADHIMVSNSLFS